MSLLPNKKCEWCKRKLTDKDGNKVYENVMVDPATPGEYCCSVYCTKRNAERKEKIRKQRNNER